MTNAWLNILGAFYCLFVNHKYISRLRNKSMFQTYQSGRKKQFPKCNKKGHSRCIES